jgi:hypothetical protein
LRLPPSPSAVPPRAVYADETHIEVLPADPIGVIALEIYSHFIEQLAEHSRIRSGSDLRTYLLHAWVISWSPRGEIREFVVGLEALWSSKSEGVSESSLHGQRLIWM